jgi:uncharacterized membrane protein
MIEPPLVPAKLDAAALGQALAAGWRTAQRSQRVSLIYAGVFALLGYAILRSLLAAGMAPLVPLAAAAFMLVGPILLAGFFGVATAVEAGRDGGFADLFAGFRRAPPAVLVVSLVCTLLCVIFATDVGILYSYQIGGAAIPPQALLHPSGGVAMVLFWGAVFGIFIGFIAFAISAFSLPLLCERRAGLIRAVSASVRGVLLNLPYALAWAALLSGVIVTSILILPLLPFTLPPLAYAGHALYRQVFPSAY